MWEAIVRRIPSYTIMMNAALAVLIPWSIYKINQALHKYGDPPWKRKN